MPSNPMAYLDVYTPSICPQGIDNYVWNLTSSYAGRMNEFSVVGTSVVMVLLATLFFSLSLYSHVSEASSLLRPTVRLGLSYVISLFLPVMSYLFSGAKTAYTCMVISQGGGSSDSELSLQARHILTWMLLVELLRKKVQAVNLVTEGKQRYITMVNHAASVGWLGYLVFFNLKGPGQMVVFGCLWIFCATKLVQRIVFHAVMTRSLAYGNNARLVSSYMDRMLQLRRDVQPAIDAPTPTEMLKSCRYVVMGEEYLVPESEAGPRGYLLDGLRFDELYKGTTGTDDDPDKVTTKVVTVGIVWRLAVADGHTQTPPLLRSNPGFPRLCLSFALFKLLRRRIERLPAMTREETDHCRDLIFRGLCDGDGEVAVFEVFHDEILFLSEYYHSVHPVALASLHFLAVNYLMVSVVVCCLCTMLTIISGKGDVPFAFRSILTDNYAMSSNVFKLLICLLKKAYHNPKAFFPAMDFLITFLLFMAFLLEQLWEFMVFLLSKWFMVSLLCTYAAKPRWRQSAVFRGAIRRISWVRAKLVNPNLVTFKQFSLLSTYRFSMRFPRAPLPREAKRSIVKRFRLAAHGHDHDRDGDDGLPVPAAVLIPLSNGRRVLQMPGRRQFMHLSWFCESESVAEVILAWHIATGLLEMDPLQHKAGTPGHQYHQMLATRLSNYCAYLVNFKPDLLPYDRQGTKCACKNVNKDLNKALGYWGNYFSSKHARFTKLMTLDAGKLTSDCRDASMTVLHKGIVLGKALMEASKGGEQPVWELLADVWVELIVYVAPSSSDEHVKGHEEALVQGGELITLLWALATHTGITRPPLTDVPV